MADIVRLPTWAMEMTDGTIAKWCKNVGDNVELGEPIAEVETDKITTNLESPYAGVLAQILVAEGMTVDVGEALAIITKPGEQLVQTQPGPAVAEAHRAPLNDRSAASQPSRGVQVEPAAQRLARDRGVDLTTVIGTGPGGRITTEDVLTADAPDSD